MWGGDLSLYADFKNIQYLKGSVVNMYIYKDLVNDIWYYTTIIVVLLEPLRTIRYIFC